MYKDWATISLISEERHRRLSSLWSRSAKSVTLVATFALVSLYIRTAWIGEASDYFSSSAENARLILSGKSLVLTDSECSV